MLTSNRYLKIIEWSETDQCYVGSCPSLMYGGCHGQDEKQVFEQLCLRVNEIMKLYEEENIPLPEPLSIHSLYGMAA